MFLGVSSVFRLCYALQSPPSEGCYCFVYSVSLILSLPLDTLLWFLVSFGLRLWTAVIEAKGMLQGPLLLLGLPGFFVSLIACF